LLGRSGGERPPFEDALLEHRIEAQAAKFGDARVELRPLERTRRRDDRDARARPHGPELEEASRSSRAHVAIGAEGGMQPPL
jgi:hypothetical protein